MNKDSCWNCKYCWDLGDAEIKCSKHDENYCYPDVCSDFVKED